jgi:hypothetical protein
MTSSGPAVVPIFANKWNLPLNTYFHITSASGAQFKKVLRVRPKIQQ